MGFFDKKGKAGVAATPATTRQQGRQAEDQALAYLLGMGMQLVERNYQVPGRAGAEIDLVMRDADGTLVFVEVRQRTKATFGGAAGSIGWAKQRRIVSAARHFLLRKPSSSGCRFDVVAIEAAHLQWLQAAFEAG